MAIVRSNGAGFGFGDELTSAQINAIDINVTNAVDKRVNGDTVSGVLQMSGAGRVIPSNATGADAATTYQPNAGNHTIYIGPSGISADRIYTLGITGVSVGDIITIKNDDTANIITVKDLAANVLAVLGPIAVNPDCDAVGASFIYLGSAWVALYFDRQAREYNRTFTTNGTFVVPRGVTRVRVEGYGGGGGGGGGTVGSGNSTDQWGGGGGGGGGAVLTQVILPVIPGTSMPVVIGTGGSGGPANTAGSSGGDTTLSATLAVFVGAAGGSAGIFNTRSAAPSGGLIAGGNSNRRAFGVSSNLFRSLDIKDGFMATMFPGQGGFGSLDPVSDVPSIAGLLHGGPSAQGFTGGAPGTVGSDSGSYSGGGIGGGGGACGSTGATGGNGGNANNAGNGTVGTAGAAAGSNNGNGGGGGGGGSHASGTPGTPGVGGSGGSGLMTITWVK